MLATTNHLHYNQSATEQTTSYNQSTANVLQTTYATSLRPLCCRRPLLQPVHGCRATGNQTTEGRRRTADAPQTQTTTTTIIYHNTTIPRYHNTTIPQYYNTTIPYYRR